MSTKTDDFPQDLSPKAKLYLEGNITACSIGITAMIGMLQRKGLIEKVDIAVLVAEISAASKVYASVAPYTAAAAGQLAGVLEDTLNGRGGFQS